MQSLHIISFDVPFPANYGGVIDVFHKLRCLKNAGTKIILHCYEYGRGVKPELENYCTEVYYYKRTKGLIPFLSITPYIVKTRQNPDLLKNLLKDDSPILFEGLHTCDLMNHPKLKKRFKIFRESNIEHHYYKHLAEAETSLIKKIFFRIEALKLKRYEKQVSNSDLMLIVSEEDTAYFQNKFPDNKVIYLPSFHAQDKVTCKTGKGNFALYHGNFMVAENTKAAQYLINNIFSNLNFPLILAGLNPPEELKNLAAKYKHIQIIASPPEKEMQELIENAQLHCMFTFQATGLKLKLLNVLYSGRFVLCNDYMLFGTKLHKYCVIKNESQEIIKEIERICSLTFNENDLKQREELLNTSFGNAPKTRKLLNYLQQKFD